MSCDGAGLGAVGPVAVDTPWWSDVRPVVAWLGAELGVPVLVLRLLRVDGGDGGRDGHVVYHVAVERHPDQGLRAEPGMAALVAADERRAPWATAEGVRGLLAWASAELGAAGRPVAAAEQVRTWNLSGLFRLAAAGGPVWLKATPGFAADEAAVIRAFAEVDAGLVPRVLGGAPGRLLIEDLPGEDCWEPSAAVVTSVVTRMARAQAALADRPTVGGPPADRPPADGPAVNGLADCRTSVMAERVRRLVDAVDGLDERERDQARRLVGGWAGLDACGLPDTVVHGDFHPGNWRGDGGPPVVLDFADAHLGNPVLDGLRVGHFVTGRLREVAERAWADAWREAVPGCDPERALAVGAPLAHLAYAVRYQEFLDGIEDSERIYHRDDPATEIRRALRLSADG